MTLTQGQQLDNRYTILTLLGQGGFGAVYKAWDDTLNIPCAIKESFILSPEGQRQFLREARILAGLRHPNLPRVTDFFTVPEQGQYLVMDFVEGQDLEELRIQSGGRLPEDQALAWIAQVCDALSYLHRQKPPVIHRDIKPPNIRIAPPDEDYPHGRAMLVDFGIAKSFDPLMRTTMGARAVTPGFSPHEQYGQTAAITDPRSDLYALGATLYALLTGQVPPESVLRLLRDPLEPPRALNPAIAPQTEILILQALQSDPELRFQNATDFKTAVTKSLSMRNSQPPEVEARPVSPYSLTRLAIRDEDATLLTPLAPSPAGSPPPRPAHAFPWKWVGIGAGLLAGLALLAGLGSLLAQQIGGNHLTQTSQARGTQTAEARSAAAFSPFIPSPLSYTRTLTPSSPSPSPSPTSSPTQLPPTPLPPRPGSSHTSSVDGMALTFIPAGTFQMGEEADRALEECQQLYEPYSTRTCSPGWFASEGPIHTVMLDSFWMDQSEVTNAMYTQCVADGACSLPSEAGEEPFINYYRNASYADYPVFNVSWSQAAAYCEWAGRRLPTEAEWEYAARGGVAGKLYPWGDTFDGSLANFCDVNCLFPFSNPNYDDGYTDVAPVGSYPANGYGLLDMAGNIWEWVTDWYGENYYATSPVKNPTGPPTGDSRVARGGAWVGDGRTLRVSRRAYYAPDFTSAELGFRCAQSWLVDNPDYVTPAPTRPPVIASPVPATPATTTALWYVYEGQAGDIQTSPVDGMVLSYIPSGTFLMGGEGGPTLSGPIHSVTLDAFWMDQIEVTNSQYAMCVAAGSCRQPWSLGSLSSSSYYAEPPYANYPVIYVDWNRASAYCAWAGRKLPTEAQWEYAARGGLADKIFPWGDSYDGSQANDCGVECKYNSVESQNDGYAETAPVGSYPANGYGLFDMAGNVWEWVADWYSPYSSAAVTNPLGPISGETRVVRGGSWYNSQWHMSVFSREWRNPTESYPNIGFRCSLSP